MSINKPLSTTATQVLYNGRWIPKQHFRVFVYKKSGEQKLVKSHDEYMDAMASGVWFKSLDDAKAKKPKNAKREALTLEPEPEEVDLPELDHDEDTDDELEG